MTFAISRFWTNSMTGEKMNETIHLGWKGRTARSALKNFLSACENVETDKIDRDDKFGFQSAECVVNGSRYVANQVFNHGF